MQIRNLKGALLREVSGYSLAGADLGGADLGGADLLGADLRGADLRGADLREADLFYADLRKANLSWADLSLTDLREADLSEADLSEADLSEADLSEADLSEAILTGAHIEGAILPAPIVPLEGEFTGYKKVLSSPHGTYDVITLRIPVFAQRTSALASRKCRASHVIVVEGEGVSPTASRSKLTYAPEITVTADRFDADRREECTHGIHFFPTREEAEAYLP